MAPLSGAAAAGCTARLCCCTLLVACHWHYHSPSACPAALWLSLGLQPTAPRSPLPQPQALQRSLGELGLPDIERAVELAEVLDSEGDDSDAEEAHRPPALPRPQLLLLQQQQQRQQEEVRLHPQRGWEQPPAGGVQAGDLLLGPNPALLAGRTAGAAGRQPSRPPAAALQRHDSGRSQLSGQQQQQQEPLAGPGPVRGHIRMGSQQQPLEGSQQLAEEEGGEEYSIDGFLSQLDRRQGAGSGGGVGASASSGIRVQPGELRLPPLPPGRRFAEEYEVGG